MGEQVTVTYKLYTRVQLGLEKIDYPKSIGFWQEDLSIPQPPRFNRTSIKGVEYQVATLYKVALFPTKTGLLEVSPMSVTAQVRTKPKNNRRSIWDDPFFSSFNNRTIKKLIRNQEKIGKTYEVLVEGLSKKSKRNLYGRTTHNSVVVFPKKEYKICRIRRIFAPDFSRQEFFFWISCVPQ